MKGYQKMFNKARNIFKIARIFYNLSRVKIKISSNFSSHIHLNLT